MKAVEAAFKGLIDYAGLYPPAGLDMRAAVRNFLAYLDGKHAWMLGRFVVEMGRLEELRAAAGERLGDVRLSVIAPASPEAGLVAGWMKSGFRVESVEIKCDEPLRMARVQEHLPERMECYFEIPVQQNCSAAVDAIAAVDARVKLRMGGVTAEAFPASELVAARLHLLADRRVAFKATAGLHHPVRGEHRLTYEKDSASGVMHGFVNLLCSAAVIHFGGSCAEASRVLEERDAGAFRVTADEVAVHGHAWNAGQVREVRKCFASFGSCSFVEPVEELEGLGWI